MSLWLLFKDSKWAFFQLWPDDVYEVIDEQIQLDFYSMSFHSNTLSRLWAIQSLLKSFVLYIVCLAKKHQTPFF